MPRAMKPDWVSKSKVRQTMGRGILGIPGEGGASSIRRSFGKHNCKHACRRDYRIARLRGQ
jgi:hypothetical protein